MNRMNVSSLMTGFPNYSTYRWMGPGAQPILTMLEVLPGPSAQALAGTISSV
jgi:hypothetical protein